MKIDRKTREIVWIFGEPTGAGDLSDKLPRAEGDLQWPYHQHSPHSTPNGTVMILDNGNCQARPFRKPAAVEDTFSPAVDYRIDEENMTARQLWQSESMGSDRVIAIPMGYVDWLPETANVLVAYGALLDPDSRGDLDWMSSSRQQFTQWTRMREYRRSVPPEVVYEVAIGSDRSDLAWMLLGAERIDRVRP